MIDPVEDASCNEPANCRGCPMRNRCWSMQHCQQYNVTSDITGRFKCHPLCLGGCRDETSSGCNTCVGLTQNGTCVESCTPPFIVNTDNLRCVTIRWCVNQKKKVFNNTCLDECPPGFTVIDYQDDENVAMLCHPCENNCEKLCKGIEINYLSDAELLKGCTIIKGSLHIKMNIDIADLLVELERYLGDIEEITGFLKVYRSMSITSFTFLRSLNVIGGEELEFNKYAIIVYENANLQTLWDWKQKTNFEIRKGSIFFHYNHKLCLTEVEKLQSITKYDNSSDAICKDSNGYKHSCDVQPIKSKVQVLSAHNVTVFWKEYNTNMTNALLGYLVSYIEAPKTDITPQYGRDTCSRYVHFLDVNL